MIRFKVAAAADSCGWIVFKYVAAAAYLKHPYFSTIFNLSY